MSENLNNFNKKINALELLADMINLSKKNSEKIIDNINDLLIIIDQDGRILRANKEFAQLLMMPLEETINSNIQLLFLQEDWEKLENLLKCFSDELIKSVINIPISSLYTKNSNRIHNMYQWKVSILDHPAKKRFSIFVIQGRFIGDISWANYQLEIMNQELETKVEERTEELRLTHQRMIKLSHYTGMAEVASNILHNLGNSVTSTFGNLQILKRRLEKDSLILVENKEEYFKMISKLLKQVENMTKVIKTQEKYVIRNVYKENLTLTQVLTDSIHILEETFSQEKISIIFDHTDDKKLYSSPPKLNNIFMIILGNAIQALKETIDKKIIINVKDNTVSIADNGIGIDPENIIKIFSHGFSTWPDHDGHGLHTAINLVKELGGEIKVKSDGINLGSTFIIVFNNNEEEAA